MSQYFNKNINLREATNQQAASNHVTPMWQSNVSDFPRRVFKASLCRNLLKFLIKRSFINWQIYMRSIYWQSMPKVKKKSDKQRQRLDKVRKRDERATNEKEVQGLQLQAKHTLKNRAYWVLDVHVANNNLVFMLHMYLLFETSQGWLPCWRVFNYYFIFFYFFFCGQVGGWVEVGGAYLDLVGEHSAPMYLPFGLPRFGGGALSSDVFTIWCRILI